jgi:1,4-alpha-glucan branching enzyme/maltooligosyltrehalose trehalohydrolase
LSALVNFAHNHDQTGNRALGERLRSLVPPGAAPLATLLALLTPAIPMMFFGEEFGSTTPFLYFADWQGDLRDAVRAGRKREFGHSARAADGREIELPDPCDVATFHASRPDEGQRDTEEGKRWMQMVQGALEVRKQHITPRQQLLSTGEHTAHRVGETGIHVCWRYSDGQAIVLELNLGAQPVDAQRDQGELLEATQLYAHAWPDGTAEGTWPAWSARWTIGRSIP